MDAAEPSGPGEPPADPEAWTDEQWLAWLEATDPESPVDHDPGPVTSGGRVARSAGGQVLGQAMLGLAQALYGRRDDEVVIVVEGGGEPDEDGPYTVHLDPDHPERSYVTFRTPPDPAP